MFVFAMRIGFDNAFLHLFTTGSTTSHVGVANFISFDVSDNFNIVFFFKALITVARDMHGIFLFRFQCATHANTLISKFFFNFLYDLVSSILGSLSQVFLLAVSTNLWLCF